MCITGSCVARKTQLTIGTEEKDISNQAVTSAQNGSGGPSVASGDDHPAIQLTGPGGAPLPTGEGIRALVAAVGHNPATVEFPSDPWGFTRSLRQAGLSAASNVRGQEDKQLVLLGTLMVLTAHVKARLKVDHAEHKRRLAQVDANFTEAEKYARNYGVSGE